jgi:UDP-N-acetylglucosamine 4,6-dehydratase/5-epimerase
MNWSKATVLVTGGTGSFGQKFSEVMLRDFRPRKLIVLSRDDLKQHEMRARFAEAGESACGTSSAPSATASGSTVPFTASTSSCTRPRSSKFQRARTSRSRLPSPTLGARNVTDAAIDCGVKRVLAIATSLADVVVLTSAADGWHEAAQAPG